MKITVHIPDDLFSAADSLARRLGVSRSALYSAAVAEFLARHAESEVTARLDRLFASEPSELELALRHAQHRSLATESWSGGR